MTTTTVPSNNRGRLRRQAGPDVLRRYEAMVRARITDDVSAELWHEGFVSGELHTSAGEEAVVVGVVDHLRDGDGLATDHRGTAPFVARGVSPFDVLAEVVGSPEGMCGGRGGHMHLADRSRRVVADGIVGSSAPTACGFALESQLAGHGGVAVAFFGEGAANQGMVLEALNLAVVWNLPVVFVCKMSGLAITTTRRQAIGAPLVGRARGFGMRATAVPGHDVERVWRAAGRAISRARRGGGPTFLLAPVHRPDGHFLGDPLLRIFRDPAGQSVELAPSLVAALREPGAELRQRVSGLVNVAVSVRAAGLEAWRARHDPLRVARRRLDPGAADEVDHRVRAAVHDAGVAALAGAGVGVRPDASGGDDG